jgi:hypothetical protein
MQLGLTLAIAVLLAAVTLTTRQPPPPAIAEFAPQAAEQIKEQPKEQSSQFGSGAGPGDCPPGAVCDAGQGDGVGAGGATTTTTAPAAVNSSLPPVVGPASVRRCVGNPPRQIEDPQSPPCVAYWDNSKGNGGKTSYGVDKDTVTIAIVDDPGNNFFEALKTFFNHRFEFYGRQIKFVKTGNNGTAGADAAYQMGAFASLPSYADIPYYRQLVTHKVIGTYRTPDFSDSELAASAPYIWGYPMSITEMLANLGDWACHRLAGQSAVHAGDPGLSGKPRSFGIWMDIGTADSTAKPDVLKSALQACGAKVPDQDVRVYPRFDNDPNRIRNEMAQAQSDGVSTIFCLCVSTNLVDLQAAASFEGYHPEWIISNYPQLIQGDGYNGLEMDRTFGVSFAPMDRVPEDHPVTWALREADPTNVNAAMRTGTIGSNELQYRGLLLLASGIQLAGPNLTPQTFMEGLQRAKFPNPDHPIMAGKVGFAGDFSMTDDAAEFWFSQNDAGPYADNQSGPTFCWVDGGKRHAKGTWPKGGDPFFKGPCDSGNRSVS